MQIILYLVLLFNFCYGTEDVAIDSEGSKSTWRRTSDGRNEDRHDIERPCSLYDLNCIRTVFAHSSHCTPVFSRIPEPFYIPEFKDNVPVANMTAVLRKIHLNGLRDYKVKEFYLNHDTDNLVLEVEIHKVEVVSPATTILYYRKGKEAIEITDFADITYKDVSLTLTIPNIKYLDLAKGHTYAYLNNATPEYQLGPAFLTNPNPQVQASNMELNGNLPIVIREIYVRKAPTLMSIILENSICSFGYH